MHPFLSEIIEQLSPGTHWSDDQILREEIFSIERLEQHARTLAAAQPVGSIPGFGRSLATRLRSNEKVLLAAYRSIAKAVDEGRSITPAAEWVLDNYHVVEEQIREIREDLPPQFYRQLPKLTAGPFAGFPRVFGIAWAFVAHTDSRFEPETLRRFVRAYQSVEPLTIGELWAVAITLRIVLVENLRRVAQRIVTSRLARQEADAVADRLLGVNGQRVDPNALRAWRDKSPALELRVRRAAGASAARSGSEDHPGAAVARRGARGARNQLRAAAAGRTSAPGRIERHGAQHHHQHAPDVGRRLGGVLRERQPGR